MSSPELERVMIRKEVCAIMGFSAATLYREIAAGRFPRPIELSKGRKGWLPSQVAARQREALRRSASAEQPTTGTNLVSA